MRCIKQYIKYIVFLSYSQNWILAFLFKIWMQLNLLYVYYNFISCWSQPPSPIIMIFTYEISASIISIEAWSLSSMTLYSPCSLVAYNYFVFCIIAFPT